MIPFRLSLGAWSPVIRRIDPRAEDGSARLALTFDDGPDPETTPHLIAALAEFAATATFFLCGIRVERHPELVQALIQAGHAVYAHGWDHRHYTPAQAPEAAAATRRTENLLARHRPTPEAYLIRLPYNDGFNRSVVHRAMRDFHPDIQFAWWTHAIADYQIAATSGSEADIRTACTRTVTQLEASSTLPGGILLLHDAPFDQPRPESLITTRMLLPEVLAMLKRRRIAAIRLEPLARPSGLGRYVFASPRPLLINPPLIDPAWVESPARAD
jgi:peptidoglycan/xylan/chitin deacetylase (PgdA/CDA1 family)